MPKRKTNVIEMKPTAGVVTASAPTPATGANNKNPEPVPMHLLPDALLADGDFWEGVEVRRRMSEQRSQIARFDNEYKGLGMALALNLAEHRVHAVDLGDGTVMEYISGPGPVTGEMVKALVDDLLRAGVQPGVLKAALDAMDERRRASGWFSVKFRAAVNSVMAEQAAERGK